MSVLSVNEVRNPEKRGGVAEAWVGRVRLRGRNVVEKLEESGKEATDTVALISMLVKNMNRCII